MQEVTGDLAAWFVDALPLGIIIGCTLCKGRKRAGERRHRGTEAGEVEEVAAGDAAVCTRGVGNTRLFGGFRFAHNEFLPVNVQIKGQISIRIILL